MKLQAYLLLLQLFFFFYSKTLYDEHCLKKHIHGDSEQSSTLDCSEAALRAAEICHCLQGELKAPWSQMAEHKESSSALVTSGSTPKCAQAPSQQLSWQVNPEVCSCLFNADTQSQFENNWIKAKLNLECIYNPSIASRNYQGTHIDYCSTNCCDIVQELKIMLIRSIKTT